MFTDRKSIPFWLPIGYRPDTDPSTDLGLYPTADRLEGVRRFPNFFEKTVRFWVQKALAQQTATKAKTKVNNERSEGVEEGVLVVEHKVPQVGLLCSV